MYSISVPSITDEQKDRWKADGRSSAEGKAGSTHPIIRVNSLGTKMEKWKNLGTRDFRFLVIHASIDRSSDRSASREVFVNQ